MQTKPYWKLIFLIPVLAAVLYGGGYIAQFIRNYKLWQDAGSIGSPVFPSYLPGDCMEALFSFPYGMAGVLICVVLLAFLLFNIMHLGDNDGEIRDKERNLSYSWLHEVPCLCKKYDFPNRPPGREPGCDGP